MSALPAGCRARCPSSPGAKAPNMCRRRSVHVPTPQVQALLVCCRCICCCTNYPAFRRLWPPHSCTPSRHGCPVTCKPGQSGPRRYNTPERRPPLCLPCLLPLSRSSSLRDLGRRCCQTFCCYRAVGSTRSRCTFGYLTISSVPYLCLHPHNGATASPGGTPPCSSCSLQPSPVIAV